MTGDPRAVLVAARKRIEKEEKWWPGKTRQPTECSGQTCAYLAIIGVNADGETERHAIAALAQCITPDLVRCCRAPAIWKYNDTHSHAEVISLLDAAIASLGSPVRTSPRTPTDIVP